ncbi:MAG: GntR family transcriptional regulator [Oscillospiraceae bacterium]
MNYTEWIFNEKSPIYIQLAHKLRYSILGGRLLPGESIPSIRSMAVMLHLNVSTVARSYRLINQDNLVFTQGKRNYCVTLNSALIQKKRIQEMERICHSFISVMTELGFSKKELLSFIQENIRSEN